MFAIIIKVTVTDRKGRACSYELPGQFTTSSSVKEIEDYVSTIHSEHMIYIDNTVAFIDWKKGITICTMKYNGI